MAHFERFIWAFVLQEVCILSILHALASLNIVGCRLWIVQEVVLARTVSLLCGDLLFNWTDLIPIADALRADHLWMTGGWSESHLALKLSNNCATICITNRTREMLNFGQFCGEYVLGNIARSLEVSDLRDKVYSVLGFIPKPIHDEIEPGRTDKIGSCQFSFA